MAEINSLKSRPRFQAFIPSQISHRKWVTRLGYSTENAASHSATDGAPHGVSSAASVSALLRDLFSFENNFQGFLSFYGFHLPHKLVEISSQSPLTKPDGVLYEIELLLVDPKSVPDGDTITVYVSISHLVVLSSVLKDVNLAATKRAKAAREKRIL